MRLAEPATSLFNLAKHSFSLDFPDCKCNCGTSYTHVFSWINLMMQYTVSSLRAVIHFFLSSQSIPSAYVLFERVQTNS